MARKPPTENLRPVMHAFKVKICYFEHLADGSAPPPIQELAGLWFGRAKGVDGDELFAAHVGGHAEKGGLGLSSQLRRW